MSSNVANVLECGHNEKWKGLSDQTGRPELGSLQLSGADLENVHNFEHLLKLIQARAMSVARRKQVGAYICGRAGTGKTKAVKDIFGAENVPYQYMNCRVSPGGLYDSIKQNPNDVFILDDVATLYKHPQGVQVLQAALNGTAEEGRLITYALKGECREPAFKFWGGVVAVSNRPLGRDPVADAVASRVRMLAHEPSDEMIASFMRSQALRGFKGIAPEECWQVVEYVIAQSRTWEYRLDLRHMLQGWQDYRLWRQRQSLGIHWKELIVSSMRQTAQEDRLRVQPVTKEEEIRLQRESVRQAMQKFPGHRKKQIEYTGLKTRTFDRRLREVKLQMK